MRLGEIKREEEGCRVGLVNEFTTFYLCLMRKEKGRGWYRWKEGKSYLEFPAQRLFGSVSILPFCSDVYDGCMDRMDG